MKNNKMSCLFSIKVYEEEKKREWIPYDVTDTYTKSFQYIMEQCKNNSRCKRSDIPLLVGDRKLKISTYTIRNINPTRIKGKSWRKCDRCNFQTCDMVYIKKHDCNYYYPI